MGGSGANLTRETDFFVVVYVKRESKKASFLVRMTTSAKCSPFKTDMFYVAFFIYAQAASGRKAYHKRFFDAKLGGYDTIP